MRPSVTVHLKSKGVGQTLTRKRSIKIILTKKLSKNEEYKASKKKGSVSILLQNMKPQCY